MLSYALFYTALFASKEANSILINKYYSMISMSSKYGRDYIILDALGMLRGGFYDRSTIGSVSILYSTLLLNDICSDSVQQETCRVLISLDNVNRFDAFVVYESMKFRLLKLENASGVLKTPFFSKIDTRENEMREILKKFKLSHKL